MAPAEALLARTCVANKTTDAARLNRRHKVWHKQTKLLEGGQPLTTAAGRIAFYAPLKPPDHPIPSGDRQMARMLLAALERAGYDAFLASRIVAYSKRPEPEHMAARKQAAMDEARRLLDGWRAGGAPALWFSYHPYDKSPDWLGEIVTRELGIPLVTAEPCKTGAAGDWAVWREESRRIIGQAAMNIVMTHADRAFLAGFVPDERVTWLDPFVDSGLLVSQPPAEPWPQQAACRLLTVGMMRAGAKLESYEALSQSLLRLTDLEWSLLIVGGGPGEDQVRAMFAPFGDRVRLAGVLAPEQVLATMEEADILAWPGCREAYGMVYLEAASRGVPSVALRNMGVPRVVEHERTGLLADPADPCAYAEALRRMILDHSLRKRLSQGALRFALGERSGDYAARRLREIIDGVTGAAAA